MGHTRLGTLPKTRKWRDVIAFFATQAEVSIIAAATVKAAEDSLQLIKNDLGFTEAAWLMTQLTVAGTQDNPLEYLQNQGIQVKEQSLLGLITAVGDALDAKVHEHKAISTQAEIAGNALTSALTKVLKPRMQQQDLFDTGQSEAESALKKLGTAKTFDHLSREFFSDMTNQSLGFFISKESAAHIGEGRCFATANQEQQFTDAVTQHTRECSKITEGYGENWIGKHHFQQKDGGVTQETVHGFAAFGMDKMMGELKRGGDVDNAG